MRVIKHSTLREYWVKTPAAETALRYWYKQTTAASWRNFPDVKQTLGQADQVRTGSGQTVCIFDIGGNKWRLIAFVSYAKGKVYVLRIMTHKEYDRKDWAGEL